MKYVVKGMKQLPKNLKKLIYNLPGNSLGENIEN